MEVGVMKERAMDGCRYLRTMHICSSSVLTVTCHVSVSLHVPSEFLPKILREAREADVT